MTVAPDPTPRESGLRRFLNAFVRGYGLDNVKSYGPASWILAAGTVWSYLGTGITIPFMVIYLTGTVGIHPSFIGLAVVVEQVVRALTSPFFGVLSDRIGRKPLMVAGLVLRAGAFLGFLAITNVPTLLMVNAVMGLAHAPYHPSLNALLADVTPRTHRVGVFGLVHMAKNMGYTLGILAGAILITMDFRVLFATAAVFPLVFALVLMLTVREPARAPPSEKRNAFAPFGAIARSGTFLLFLVVATSVFLSWGQMDYVLPRFVHDAEAMGFGTDWVTVLFLVNGLLVLLFQVPISAQTEKWARTNGLAAAGAVTAIALGILGFIALLVQANPGFLKSGLIAAVVVLTAAEMIETPLIFALAADLAPPNVVGGAMGVLALAAPVGMGAAPFIAGLVEPVLGWAWVWWAFGLIVLAGASGFLLFGQRRERMASAEATTTA